MNINKYKYKVSQSGSRIDKVMNRKLDTPHKDINRSERIYMFGT